MYESETAEVILARMLERLSDSLDKREGSVLADILSPAAIENEQAYAEMDNVLNLGFADTTYGDYLDRRCAEQGVTRKSATQAIGSVTITAQDGTFIPQGTRLSTSDVTPIYFVTTADATVSGATVDVPIEAEVGGVDGNVSSGTIALVIGDLASIITVNNASETTGGVDEETDEELLVRYQEKISRPITSGNQYQYEQWAKDISGISDARCYPVWNGPGTVKVVCIDENKLSPAQSILDIVSANIEANRPIGATVTVVGVTEHAINVSATLTLAAGSVLNDVITAITENITAYYESISFVDQTVRYSKIANAILDTEGVIDYTNLLVNGATGNIVLNTDEVPIIGTTNFTQ
jgi:uncharacterized phage protein gp47/JayE